MCHTSVCFPFEKHNLLDENCSFLSMMKNSLSAKFSAHFGYLHVCLEFTCDTTFEAHE